MKKKEIFLLSIGIFFTAIAWLMADIYHAATKERIKYKIELPNVSKYEINKEILNSLERKTE